MKKDVRNRRSTSSCSNYSQHSISIANIDPPQPQPKQHKDKKSDFTDIQKQYLQLYSEIKGYAVGEAGVPQKSMLFKWKQFLKVAIQQSRQYFKNISHNLQSLRTTVSQAQWAKNEELRQLKQLYEQQIKQKQNESNKRLIDITSQFSRKEQQYKEVISKFIQTLHCSQKNWSKFYTQMATKVKKTQQLLKSHADIDQRNQEAYEKIMLGLEGGGGIGPAQMQDQSIASINLSCDQLGLYAPVKLESRRNTIDISSIEQIEECEEVQAGDHQYRLEDMLSQLISWGFFTQKNNPNIQKLITLLKNMQQPQQLCSQPIYPILIQSIKLSLNLQQQDSSIDQQQEYQQVNNNENSLMYLSNNACPYQYQYGYPRNTVICDPARLPMRTIGNQV